MKSLKPTITALLCLLCLPGRADNEVRMHLDIKNLEKGDTLCLSWGAMNKSMSPLIMQLTPKTDTLSIPMNEPRLIVIGIKGMEGGYELVAAPGENIDVTGHLHIDNMGKRPRAEFRKIKVKGARYQQEYEAILTNYIYHLDSLDTDIDLDFKGIKKIIFWAKNKNDEQAIADMYQTREGQDYIDRVASNFNDKNKFLEQLISGHSDTFIGPMLMLRFGGRLTPEQYSLYESMSEEAKNSYYGREVRDEVAPSALRGSMAPTVTVEDGERKEKLLSFSDYGNKVLLIDFWASWCQPCIKEMANLQRLYEKLHDKGLEIISISADRNFDDWKEAVEDLSLPWKNYIDISQQAATEYAVKYIPTLFVVDAKGNIIAEKLRGIELETYLLNYLGM